QSGAVKTSRSTVGTLTGVNDYLKLLWARFSTAFCPQCDVEVRPENASSAADDVARLPEEEFPALVVASVPLFSAESSVAPADRSAARSRSEANGFVDVVRDTLVAQGFVRFLRGGDVPVRVEDIVAEDLSGG